MEAFLSGPIVVEEKVDGANLGISFDRLGNIRAQNRGSYLNLPGVGQWLPLQSWLELRRNELFEMLTERFILFGEWCYAVHSIYYDRLPDWFLGFDVFDTQTSRFVDLTDRNHMLSRLDVKSVPILGESQYQLSDLLSMLTVSRLSSQPAEGLYLRSYSGKSRVERAKIVREDFVQSIEEHWTNKPFKTNRIVYH